MTRWRQPEPYGGALRGSNRGLEQERPEDRRDVVPEDQFSDEISAGVDVPLRVGGRPIGEAVDVRVAFEKERLVVDARAGSGERSPHPTGAGSSA